MTPELTIADLILNRPLCVAHAKLDLVLSVLSRRLNIVEANGFSFDPSRVRAMEDDEVGITAAAAPRQNWSDVGHGVAVLPVSGSLVNRTRGLDAMSGLQSYKQISQDFSALMADPSVLHIALMMDSNGGSVSGLPDLVDQIVSARGTKPVTAIVDDSAYSAAYWIASAAGEIVVSRTSGVANIGAMAVHTDRSVMNEKVGIKVTAVVSGTKKALLSSDAPLSDAGLEYLQGEVDRMGTMFIEGAAQNRKLAASFVRDLEGEPMHGPKAVELGLADRVMSANAALADLVARYRPSAGTRGNPGRVQRAAQAMAMSMAK